MRSGFFILYGKSNRWISASAVQSTDLFPVPGLPHLRLNGAKTAFKPPKKAAGILISYVNFSLKKKFENGMKHQNAASRLAICLTLFSLFFSAGALRAQINNLNLNLRQFPSDEIGDDKVQVAPRDGFKLEVFQLVANTPQVDVTFDQADGTAVLYHPVAAWVSNQQGKAQLSLQIWVKNKEAKVITWQKVRFEYTQGGAAKSKEMTFSKAINPNAWDGFQNSRDYHQEGDVVYIDAPIPASVTIKLYFKEFVSPVTMTKTLKPYTQGFNMPFRAYDLQPNEVWESASTHGGGSQVFAYDMGVQGNVGGNWSSLLPGKDGSKNEDYRIWGKPVYAMADGTIADFCNDVPNNPKPGEKANFAPYPHGGAGNHFYIKHGDVIALYAHMQKGSLNKALLQKGAVVHEGDFLGYAGNAGNSTGPHLHVHIRKETTVESGPFRPLVFDHGYAIDKAAFPTLVSNANWTKLNNLAIPGFTSHRAFIWPGNDKPQYGNDIFTAVFRSGSGGHYLWAGVDKNNMVNKDNTLKNQGLRLTDLSVSNIGGAIKYTGAWRAGSGKSFLQPGTTWAAFSTEWSALSAQGYRLIDLEVYNEGGQTKFAGVYGEGNDGYYLFVGMSQADFNAKWTELGGKGQRLIDIEVYKEGGAIKYAGVWRAGNDGYYLWHANSWNAFTTKWDELGKQGQRLVDLDVCVDGGTTYYSGVFRAGSDGYYLWESNWNSFKAKWDDLTNAGMRLVDINVR